jgi:hypothetical protein
MTQTHPITPPPELLDQWCLNFYELGEWRAIAIHAAQWGADQELEAVEEEIIAQGWFANSTHRRAQLRAARRPKPPTLKEQAMRVLVENGTNLDGRMELDSADIETIRRALEALDD